jgi:hypothetical protein
VTARAPRPASAERLPDVEQVVRATVEATAPQLTIVRAWGHRWYKGVDLVLCFGAFQKHVGVEFWRGASLRDPKGLLEGTGKNLRHVKLRSRAQASAPKFRALIREAVSLDRRSPPRPRSGVRSRRPTRRARD